MSRRREILGPPDELLVESEHRQSSYQLPLAISHLLDIKVEQANSGLEQAGEERTTRQETVATLIATIGRDDIGDLSLEERIMYYRRMTIGDLLPESDESKR